MSRGGGHWRHALGLFAAHVATWTPYRYLIGAFVGAGAAMYLLDIPAKLLGIFGLTLLFARALDGGGLRYIGLTGRGAAPAVALGLLGAASSWAVGEVLVPWKILGHPTVDLVELNWRWASYAVNVSLVVGLSEEAMDRGYIYRELRRDLTGPWGTAAAALVSSTLFAVSHIPIDVFVYGMSPWEMAWHLYGVFGFGLVMCLYLDVTGNLLGPVAMHSAWDLLVGTFATGGSILTGLGGVVASTAGLVAGAAPALVAWRLRS